MAFSFLGVLWVAMGPGDVQYYSSTRILSMFRFSTCCISICNWVFTVLRMFLSSFIEFYTILMCLWFTLLNVSYNLDVVCCFMVVFCSPFGIFHSSFFVFLYGAHLKKCFLFNFLVVSSYWQAHGRSIRLNTEERNYVKKRVLYQ